MLGNIIRDPDGIEGPAGEVAGLGLLDVETVLTPEKQLSEARARHQATGMELCGYEMHIGHTSGPDTSRAFASIDGRADGAISSSGQVAGTYLHGIFTDDQFRQKFFSELGVELAAASYSAVIDQVLDDLAVHLEETVDVDAILRIAGASNA
jgi:adenosylcobyric acid synthase